MCGGWRSAELGWVEWWAVEVMMSEAVEETEACSHVQKIECTLLDFSCGCVDRKTKGAHRSFEMCFSM